MNNPFLIYFVGISGSGKTTIAERVSQALTERGLHNLQFIDGDIIRSELNGIFGYSFEERMKNNRVVCVIASYLLRNNINVILAQVGGYQAMREQVCSIAGNNYIEIYVKCSVEECARRDVKGYYHRAQKGEMDNLNGKNTDFEIPEKSDLVIDTEKCSIDEAVDMVLRVIEKKGYF